MLRESPPGQPLLLPVIPAADAKLLRKRQYVYRLGIWGAAKYKKSHHSSGLGHPDNHPGGSSKATGDEPRPAKEATPPTGDLISGSPPTTFHQM
jgi:hypothetical protein